jgi:formylglycine-generating enzyme required for sulfatase activity
MRALFALAVAIFALALRITSAEAQARVALVIGNSGYQNVPALPNPANDATDIAASLERLGFAVRRVIDGTFKDMRLALREFIPLARQSDMAVVYFAGHGIEIAGDNWLIPVDAELDDDIAMEQEAVALRSLMPIVGAASRLGLIILDACRNNPFAARMKRHRPARAVERGLARVEPATSVLVSFAAKEGTTANDGPGRNSPFTAALLRQIETPGLELNFLFRNVREEVLKATNARQEPVVYGALPGAKVYLRAAEKPVAGPSMLLDAEPAASAWAATQNTTSFAVLEDFIRHFGGTPYASMAQARLDEMQRQIAAATPPVPPAAPLLVSPVAPLLVPPATPLPGEKLALAAPAATLQAPQSLCSTALVSAASPSRMAAPLSPAEECALRPGDAFKECERCPEMVVVPAGTFTMGSPESEEDRVPDESPQHEVTFARPFAIGRFDVTVDQYAAFVAATGYDSGSRCQTFEDGRLKERLGRSWRFPGFAQRGSHPAVCLNWNDAKAYADWLADKTGKTYHVVTEAEWEYAARALTRPGGYPRYWFGSEEADLCRYANVADQTAKSVIVGASAWKVTPCHDGYPYTSPVGAFAANRFGLHDMSGNASQWTSDCLHDDYMGAPSDGSAWVSGDCRVHPVRGGSWYNFARNLRAAVRIWANNDYRLAFVGLRLARALSR